MYSSFGPWTVDVFLTYLKWKYLTSMICGSFLFDFVRNFLTGTVLPVSTTDCRLLCLIPLCFESHLHAEYCLRCALNSRSLSRTQHPFIVYFSVRCTIHSASSVESHASATCFFSRGLSISTSPRSLISAVVGCSTLVCGYLRKNMLTGRWPTLVWQGLKKWHKFEQNQKWDNILLVVVLLIIIIIIIIMALSSWLAVIPRMYSNARRPSSFNSQYSSDQASPPWLWVRL